VREKTRGGGEREKNNKKIKQFFLPEVFWYLATQLLRPLLFKPMFLFLKEKLQQT
jgi:hypothetical protein